MDRREAVELALAHGAEVTSIPFLDVLLTGDRALVLSFLERGADPVSDHPFARAFQQLRAKTILGSYMDCRRLRPDLAEGLQRQADMALRQFAQDGNLKWVSLMMWAGADPRSSGPTVEDPDDSEWSTTALHEASWSGSVGVLKRLQPTPSDDLPGMFRRASERANAGAIDYLLTIGAGPNDKPDGGSSALDSCLRILGWEELERVEHGDFATYEDSPQNASRARPAIRVLLRHGAVWTPDFSALNATRRILYKLEPDLLVELLGQLRARETGEAALRELLRVRQLREFVAFCERRLQRFCGHERADQQLARSDQETSRRIFWYHRPVLGDNAQEQMVLRLPKGFNGQAVQAEHACPPTQGFEHGNLADVAGVVDLQFNLWILRQMPPLRGSDDCLGKRMAQAIEMRVAGPAWQLVTSRGYLGALRRPVEIERRLREELRSVTQLEPGEGHEALLVPIQRSPGRLVPDPQLLPYFVVEVL